MHRFTGVRCVTTIYMRAQCRMRLCMLVANVTLAPASVEQRAVWLAWLPAAAALWRPLLSYMGRVCAVLPPTTYPPDPPTVPPMASRTKPQRPSVLQRHARKPAQFGTPWVSPKPCAKLATCPGCTLALGFGWVRLGSAQAPRNPLKDNW